MGGGPSFPRKEHTKQLGLHSQRESILPFVPRCRCIALKVAICACGARPDPRNRLPNQVNDDPIEDSAEASWSLTQKCPGPFKRSFGRDLCERSIVTLPQIELPTYFHHRRQQTRQYASCYIFMEKKVGRDRMRKHNIEHAQDNINLNYLISSMCAFVRLCASSISQSCGRPSLNPIPSFMSNCRRLKHTAWFLIVCCSNLKKSLICHDHVVQRLAPLPFTREITGVFLLLW